MVDYLRDVQDILHEVYAKELKVEKKDGKLIVELVENETKSCE